MWVCLYMFSLSSFFLPSSVFLLSFISLSISLSGSLTCLLPPLLSPVLLVMLSFNKATYSQQRMLHQLSHHCFISLHSRHGGHPAAPGLACRFQSERRGPVRAGRQLPLPQHEAFVHVRLRLHLLLLHHVLSVSPACILHLLSQCGL